MTPTQAQLQTLIGASCCLCGRPIGPGATAFGSFDPIRGVSIFACTSHFFDAAGQTDDYAINMAAYRSAMMLKFQIEPDDPAKSGIDPAKSINQPPFQN